MKSEREAEHQRAKRHNYGKIAIACLPTFVSQDNLGQFDSMKTTIKQKTNKQ
jgi:hypothetical protein